MESMCIYEIEGECMLMRWREYVFMR
jgi:hypothetical protein